MPRPKGSKNKKKTEIILDANALDEQIKAAEAEIETMTAALKEKKAELKKLVRDRTTAEKAAVEKKAEEDKAKLLEAVAASGKSIEEVLELLK